LAADLSDIREFSSLSNTSFEESQRRNNVEYSSEHSRHATIIDHPTVLQLANSLMNNSAFNPEFFTSAPHLR